MVGKAASINTRAGCQEIAKLLRQHDNYLVISHVRPDGDAIGSTLAMMHLLKALGKRAIAYNVSPIPEKFFFIPGAEEIRGTYPQSFEGVTLILDTGSLARVHEGFRPLGFTVNIDHHATNDTFGDVNWIDPDATAVGEMMFDLIDAMEVPLNEEIAISLLTAIVTDTGGFRYPNTTPKTLHQASRLAAAGASVSLVAKEVYESRTREEVVLIGRAYSRLTFLHDGCVAWTELRWRDYQEVGGIDSEPDGLSGDLRSIIGVELGVLFHELEEGGLRANFRGRGRVDCAALAASFGGGGHRNASGCYLPGADFEAQRQAILDAIARIYATLP